ncbi:MAG: hypothetical protein LEGION0398_MBIBDBAK_01332 [Legionellaceae bacterium]
MPINENTLNSMRKQTQEHINLSDKGLIDEDIKLLCDAIKSNSNIVSLDLKRNNLSSLSAKYISDLPYLKKLNLSQNSIRDEGIKYLTKNSFSNLENLDVSSTGITDEGAALLLEKNYKSLYCSDNKKLSSKIKEEFRQRIVENDTKSKNTQSFSNISIHNSAVQNLFSNKSTKIQIKKDLIDDEINYVLEKVGSLSPDQKREFISKLAKKLDVDIICQNLSQFN